MNLGPCKTNEDAANVVVFLRQHKPFKYGGTWYVAAHDGQGFAYRSMRSLMNRLAGSPLKTCLIVRAK